MNYSDIPTPALPKRESWHDDATYTLLLEDYIQKYRGRPFTHTHVTTAMILRDRLNAALKEERDG